jgi:hypothetical protein
VGTSIDAYHVLDGTWGNFAKTPDWGETHDLSLSYVERFAFQTRHPIIGRMCGALQQWNVRRFSKNSWLDEWSRTKETVVDRSTSATYKKKNTWRKPICGRADVCLVIRFYDIIRHNMPDSQNDTSPTDTKNRVARYSDVAVKPLLRTESFLNSPPGNQMRFLRPSCLLF